MDAKKIWPNKIRGLFIYGAPKAAKVPIFQWPPPQKSKSTKNRNWHPNLQFPLREINHHIPYHRKAPWVAHKYRLPEAQRAALEKGVNAKLASGIMRYTSDIPLAPSHMVPKKDGQYRHVQDLRKRNLDTDIMLWPLPDQEELVYAVARSTNRSIFDLISTFDQTRIDPKDEQFATIINHMGILQQRVIQQGDKNAVATLRN